MNCHNHPLRQGVNTCCMCGHWLCDECSRERDGRISCKDCLTGSRIGSRHDGMFPNAFLLILFSGLPGANYMYMGLIKRGLFVMTAFFVSIYLSGFFTFSGFIIPIVVITSFFDGLRIRRKFIAGVPVSDDIDDIKNFFSANKLPIIGFFGLLIVMEILQSVTRFLFGRQFGFGMLHSGRAFHGLILIVAITVGLYFLSKRRKDKSPVNSDRDLQ